jgi:CDP-diacylglycerol pyrophosphatase
LYSEMSGVLPTVLEKLKERFIRTLVWRSAPIMYGGSSQPPKRRTCLWQVVEERCVRDEAIAEAVVDCTQVRMRT